MTDWENIDDWFPPLPKLKTEAEAVEYARSQLADHVSLWETDNHDPMSLDLNHIIISGDLTLNEYDEPEEHIFIDETAFHSASVGEKYVTWKHVLKYWEHIPPWLAKSNDIPEKQPNIRCDKTVRRGIIFTIAVLNVCAWSDYKATKSEAHRERERFQKQLNTAAAAKRKREAALRIATRSDVNAQREEAIADYIPPIPIICAIDVVRAALADLTGEDISYETGKRYYLENRGFFTRR